MGSISMATRASRRRRSLRPLYGSPATPRPPTLLLGLPHLAAVAPGRVVVGTWWASRVRQVIAKLPSFRAGAAVLVAEAAVAVAVAVAGRLPVGTGFESDTIQALLLVLCDTARSESYNENRALYLLEVARQVVAYTTEITGLGD